MRLKINRAIVNCLIRSAIETYPTETSGYLLGNHRISEASPYQCPRRSVYSVVREEKSARRVFKVVKFLGGKFVGEFHSHTGDDTGLSTDDIIAIKNLHAELKPLGLKMKKWIEIIISVYEKRKSQSRPYINLTQNKTNLHVTLPKSKSSVWDVNLRAYSIDIGSGHSETLKLSI